MSGPSPIHRMLTALMSHLMLGDPASARRLLDSDPGRIPELRMLLDRTRLGGYFHCLIEGTDLVDCFPTALRQELTHAYDVQAGRNDRNLLLMQQIQEAFDAVGLPFLILKGLYVAQRFFGDIHRRFMWDIDILVHPDDLPRALDTLAAMDYCTAAGVPVDPRNRFWGIHAVEVTGPGGKIDVHHTVRNLPGIRLDQHRMWREAGQFSIRQRYFRTLSDFDTLLAAALGLGADLQAGHHNLRKIWDVYVMLLALDRTADWKAFFEARRSEGSLKLLLNVFSFTLLLCSPPLSGLDQTDAAIGCPRLLGAFTPHRDLLIIHDRNHADRIFLRPRQHLANRLLFSRLLPVSPGRYWLGWLSTLGVRVLHYRGSGRPPAPGQSRAR